MIKVDLLGANEILKAFSGLPYQFTDTTVQKANVRAAQPMVARIHYLSPVGLTGQLADSIGVVKSGKNNKGELGAVEVGPRRKGGFKGYVGHLVEFGTKVRRTDTGANRGAMPENPFIEQGFEQTVDEVRNRQAIELGNVTMNFLRRTLK